MFEIGQVWRISWTKGDEALSGHRSYKSRTGVLTGIEMDGAEATRLYFSCPMMKESNTTAVYPRDFLAQGPIHVGSIQVFGPVTE